MTQHSSTPTSPTGEQVITIQNCNSISEAVVTLRASVLNIKYGPNGLGKSTIAQALTLQAGEDPSLDLLIPFKHRGASGGPQPKVLGAENIRSVLTFNDKYVSRFVFQKDEVLRNSFEIFVSSPEYEAGLVEIQAIFEDLQTTFTAEAEFVQALTSFTELQSAFNVTKSGGVAKNSRGVKGLSVAAKLHSIPEGLLGYQQFLHSEDPAGWVTWQARGTSFLSLSDNCPFCSSPEVDKTLANKVAEEYESAAVRNMSTLRSTIEKLGRYIESTHLAKLNELTTTIQELSPENETFIIGLRSQVDTLLRRLTGLQQLSFYSLRDEPNIETTLRDLKLDLGSLVALNSTDTKSVAELINAKLDEVASKIGRIKGAIAEQKGRVAKSVKNHQASINEFLQSAGYNYVVKIESHESSYRMLLEHQDLPGHIESAADHLSYGEKNAFALVLFMHHVQQANPDLVVLDDPVSSFDKTKKFAILHQLFRGRTSLRGRTTLLLTHDIEPAIDIVRTGTSRFFEAASPSVTFLTAASGVVSEKPINRRDITTFTEVCRQNVAASADAIIKCIHLRRLFEVSGTKGLEYNLLSSLLHLRNEPTKRTDVGTAVEMTDSEITTASATIQAHISGFEYLDLLTDLQSFSAVKAKYDSTSIGYEKVQLFRILAELRPEQLQRDDIFAKFVNETYHIENEYVMQLNPRDFDAVPEFVLEACTALIEAVDAS
ncbi:hypothetical protein BFL36_13065 [Clavibacter michiganensis]|uniref:Protein CR006 P-loop domain-containing protein n=1 Tax=Clavibacter michiganensis TaxID=28447 RepID=A0A251Y3W5_9MICO|nr:AAA family ATPase [Clavibacter michiganensis]OUE18967.1 hypothetical protein BFL36_13065 [Clavibacter michiganensis]